MRSPLTRTVLIFVFPFCCNDTMPDCNLPTKEVSQCNYSWELCLLFSDYSPKLEDTYFSQIIPGIICQSLLSASSQYAFIHDVKNLVARLEGGVSSHYIIHMPYYCKCRIVGNLRGVHFVDWKYLPLCWFNFPMYACLCPFHTLQLCAYCSKFNFPSWL